VHVQRLGPDRAAQVSVELFDKLTPNVTNQRFGKASSPMCQTCMFQERLSITPDDMPSLHRSKETVRGKHRKSSKVNENITHKPEGVPTPLSIQKHHLPIQLQRDQLQPARPTGVVCRPHALPGSNYQAVELHQHTFGLTHASGPATQSRCRGQK